MNASVPIIKAALPVAIALAAFAAPAADAPEPDRIVIECARPAQPSLHAIIDLTGKHDNAQARADRDRVMAQAHRACHREGIRQVWVVRELPYTVARNAGPQVAATARPAK